jgi:putative transposase
VGVDWRAAARPGAAEGRKKKAPTAAILDSQSVKTAGQGGACGYDANKKIKGRKRHLLTDTPGWLLGVEITAASVQDRDGAKPLLRRATLAFGRLSKVWADSGYAGKFVAWVKQLRPHGRLHLEVVRSPKPAKGFAVQPRRWVIERSFAWLTKCRRLVKDYERLLSHSAAFIHLAFTGLMLRSLTR